MDLVIKYLRNHSSRWLRLQELVQYQNLKYGKKNVHKKNNLMQDYRQSITKQWLPIFILNKLQSVFVPAAYLKLYDA